MLICRVSIYQIKSKQKAEIMNLGKSLKIALIKAELSQIELAEKIGVSKQQVNNWTRADGIRSTNLNKVCNALNLSVSEFIALGEE
jgi:DNA-binding Xre family transcriptional regulator